jgi:hypothetical protein
MDEGRECGRSEKPDQPVDPRIFALAGLGTILEAAEQARRYLGASCHVAGIVLTRTRRDNVSRDVEHQLRERYGSLVMVTTVPTVVAIEEANSRFLSVLNHAPSSPGAKAYVALAEEILGDGKRSQGRSGHIAVKPAAPPTGNNPLERLERVATMSFTHARTIRETLASRFLLGLLPS